MVSHPIILSYQITHFSFLREPGGRIQVDPIGLTLSVTTEYKQTEDYLKRKTIENYVRCFCDWPPCS